MMCERPYLKTPLRTTRKNLWLSNEAKDASTPFPCGKCLPCRINRARVWQHRMELEASVHLESSFVTLTYQDEFLPFELKKDHLQKFIKRLRYYGKRKIRYYAVGEYGTKFKRPHYHIIAFNMGDGERDLVVKAWSVKGEFEGFRGIERLRYSERQRLRSLEEWFREEKRIPIGRVELSGVGPESCRYVSGYIVKGHHFKNCDALEGKMPEFSIMSKGLGKEKVDMIVENILKGGKSEWIEGVQILCYGKKNLPLGRYLTKRMEKGLGLSEGKIKEKFREYQSQIFEKHWEGPGIYKDRIINEEKGKREQQKRKIEIFKQRRTL